MDEVVIRVEGDFIIAVQRKSVREVAVKRLT